MKHAGKGNSSAQDFAFVAKSVKTCTLSQKNLPIAEGKETVRNSESEEAEVHQPHRKDRRAVHIRISDGLPAWALYVAHPSQIRVSGDYLKQTSIL